MSKSILSLCVYDIDTVHSDVSVSVVAAPLSTSANTYQLNCYYQNADGNFIHYVPNGDPDGTNSTFYGVSLPYTIPYWNWNKGSKVFYIVKAEAASNDDEIVANPILFRADNGVVVVLDDDLDGVINSLKTAQCFTGLTPNENGCITLDLLVKGNTYNEKLYATIYYYVTDDPSLSTTLVGQTFPIYYLECEHFRLGFKTFYSTTDESFSLNTIPIAWVAISQNATIV